MTIPFLVALTFCLESFILSFTPLIYTPQSSTCRNIILKPYRLHKIPDVSVTVFQLYASNEVDQPEEEFVFNNSKDVQEVIDAVTKRLKQFAPSSMNDGKEVSGE